MTRRFFKTKDCSCIVFAIICGVKNTENGIKYLIGGHNHFRICKKCEKLQEINKEDTLYDMWCNDNITDDYGFAGWKIDHPNI